jgi:hypothetical protein
VAKLPSAFIVLMSHSSGVICEDRAGEVPKAAKTMASAMKTYLPKTLRRADVSDTRPQGRPE